MPRSSLRTPEPATRRAADRAASAAGGRGSTAIVTAVLVGVFVMLAVGLTAGSYNIWGAALVAPVLLLAALLLALAAGRAENDLRITRFIMFAAMVKILGGTAARYLMVYELYDSGDARLYHEIGIDLATQFRRGDFDEIGALDEHRVHPDPHRVRPRRHRADADRRVHGVLVLRLRRHLPRLPGRAHRVPRR